MSWDLLLLICTDVHQSVHVWHRHKWDLVIAMFVDEDGWLSDVYLK